MSLSSSCDYDQVDQSSKACEYSFIFSSILKLDGVFMYLDMELSREMQKERLVSTGVRFVIAEKGNFSDFVSCQIVRTVVAFGVELYIMKVESCTHDQSLQYSGVFQLAYIIHTSGSTGTAKIVRVPHSCIAPNIVELRYLFIDLHYDLVPIVVFHRRQKLHVSQTDVIFMSSPFTFDPSIVDIFVALSSGSKLLMVEPKLKAMPLRLAKILQSNKVTLMQSTPSLFQQFGPLISAQYLLGPSSSLRAIILGGEPFPPLDTIKKYRHRENRTEFYNIYGITEVSCWASIFKVSSNDLYPEPIPLGEPMHETSFQVRNDDGLNIENGIGHLYIGGNRTCLLDGESPGSLQHPVYRNTGDIVSLHKGSYYYQSRSDNTAKRMGKLISLHALQQAAVRSTLVDRAHALIDDRKRLVLACVPCSEPSGEVVERLRETFKLSFSAHQVPDDIVMVPYLPLSKHGKIDRIQLLQMVGQKRHAPATVQPPEWGELLISLWKDAIASQPCDADYFVLSGGSSLSAVRLSQSLEDRTQSKFPRLLDLLLNYTWRDVSRYVQEEAAKQPAKSNQTIARIYTRAMHFEEGGQTVVAPLCAIESRHDPVHIDVTLSWKCNMRKCIDASPLIIER